jgi:hypothetical protein
MYSMHWMLLNLQQFLFFDRSAQALICTFPEILEIRCIQNPGWRGVPAAASIMASVPVAREVVLRAAPQDKSPGEVIQASSPQQLNRIPLGTVQCASNRLSNEQANRVHPVHWPGGEGVCNKAPCDNEKRYRESLWRLL